MHRKEFLKNLAAVGIASPFLSFLAACDKEDLLYPEFDVNFSGKIIIVGAGAAGLTAGYILNKYNIDFEILEASAVYGGRVKKIDDFADFPIDLGGEWIHTDPSVLARIISDPNVKANMDVITYNPQTFSLWKNGKLKKRNIASNFYSEHKFKDATWFDFLDQYIAPGSEGRIQFNQAVREIDYSGDRVKISTVENTEYEADKVLVTVPITMLKNNSINFQPTMPNDKLEAINSIDMPAILKVFIEFSERFYPDIILLNDLNADDLYYDAAFGKTSNSNILGLFAIGDLAETYTALGSDDKVIAAVLENLDQMFDGNASATYKKHVIQNWTNEPFIQGSYGHFQGSEESTIETLVTPLDNKVYFAGEACNLNGDTATVHGAGESAYSIVERMLKA